MIPDRRVRLFLQTASVNRQIAWFEMRGDDLYFGPAERSGVDLPPIPIRGLGVRIRIPEQIRRLQDKGLKASYHASGQFHIKAKQTLVGPPTHWPKKGDLDSPFRVAALISKAASHYPEYARHLTRGGADAVVLRLPDAEVQRRHYFEFFISPPGAFERPTPMLKVHGEVFDSPICSSLSENFILVIRHLALAASMPIHTGRSDIEVWFFVREVEPGGDPQGPS